MAEPTNAKCTSDVLQRIQTVLRDHMATETAALETIWADGIELPIPSDEDIQIGPEYNFTADPIIGIEWSQDTQQLYIGPRADHRIILKVRLAFNDNQSVGNIGIKTARYGRAIWVTLRKNYVDDDGTIHELELEEIDPGVWYDPDQGIEGNGVEMTLIANSQFTLPPY